MRAARGALAAVAGIALVGGGVFAANEIKDNIAQSQRCESVKAFVPVKKISDAEPQVAILGDSYTAGDGLADRTKGWAYQVGTDLAGVGGTGFVNGGYCGDHTYLERWDTVLATSPGTLIIQGGLNDWGSAEKVADAALAVIDRADDTVPRVVIVGPPDVPGRDGEDKVDTALHAAAATMNAEYVSALGWDDLEYLPDETHLTEAGHAAFAARVASAVKD